MSEAAPAEPSLTTKIISAVITALFVVAIWSFIHWRTTPPPPPKVQMPAPTDWPGPPPASPAPAVAPAPEPTVRPISQTPAP